MGLQCGRANIGRKPSQAEQDLQASLRQSDRASWSRAGRELHGFGGSAQPPANLAIHSPTYIASGVKAGKLLISFCLTQEEIWALHAHKI